MALFNLDIIKDEKVVVNNKEYKIEDVKMKEYIEFQRKLKSGELNDDIDLARYLCNLMIPTLDFEELSVSQYRELNTILVRIMRGETTEKKSPQIIQR